MSEKSSIWTRIKQFFRPERESYDTRPARPGEPGAGPEPHIYEATDSRRYGGSGAIGG